NGMVKGAMQEPRLIGQLSGNNLRIYNSRWSSAKGTVQLSPSEFVLQSAFLVGVSQGKAFLSGSIGLRNWSYTPSNPMRVNLSMQRLHVSDVQGMANLHHLTFDEVSGEINFHGSQLDPDGVGTVTILNAQIFDEPLRKVTLEFRAGHGSVTSIMNIGAPAGSATANLSYVPAARSYDLRLSAPSIILEELHAVRERNLSLRGVAKVSAAGQGTLDKLQLTAT